MIHFNFRACSSFLTLPHNGLEEENHLPLVASYWAGSTFVWGKVHSDSRTWKMAWTWYLGRRRQARPSERLHSSRVLAPRAATRVHHMCPRAPRLVPRAADIAAAQHLTWRCWGLRISGPNQEGRLDWKTNMLTSVGREHGTA